MPQAGTGHSPDPLLPPGKGGLGSTKFVAFETLAWHNECFFCHLCKDSMVGKGFIQVSLPVVPSCLWGGMAFSGRGAARDWRWWC